jgi:hypothetical protein
MNGSSQICSSDPHSKNEQSLFSSILQDIGNFQPCDPNFCEFDSFIGPYGLREVNEYVYKQEEALKIENNQIKLAGRNLENDIISFDWFDCLGDNGNTNSPNFSFTVSLIISFK